MNITPGEPVPPGFEDEIDRVAEIQSVVVAHQGSPLIGIEYTVELYHDDDRERGYICLLCDKRGDPRTIIAHWKSFNHRLKYLEKHFPSAIRELAPIRYKPDSRSTMNQIIISLSEAIEEHHGRLQLTVCNSDDFRRLRNNLQDEVNAMFHYDECNGPTFVNIVDRVLMEPENQQRKLKDDQTLQITIKAPKRINAEALAAVRISRNRDSLDSISSDSDGQQPSSNKKLKHKSQSPAYRVLPRVRRSPPFEETRTFDSEKKANTVSLPTPKELSIQASQIAQERYKWEKYRCMLDIYMKSINQLQKDNEKNPEKHPLYPEEWKKFWNRRYKELQSEKKIDPNKYDYKPEWIIFWTRRMKELYNDDLENKKKELKTKLGLPENAEEKTDQLKEKYKVQVVRNVSAGGNMSSKSAKDSAAKPTRPPAGNKAKPTAVIDISDDSEPSSPNRSRSNSKHPAKRSSRGRSKSNSLSPLSDDYERRSSQQYNKVQAYERARAAHSAREAHRYATHIPPTEFYHPGFHRPRFPEAPHFVGHSGYRVLDPYKYPKYEHISSPQTASSKKEEVTEVEPEDEGPLTVVAVLRLLTALEDHLGSLGPKVVDLLGKALALEKVKANSADDMLINEDYCVFFETIKEKLKGLLIADVLEDAHKVKAVKKAIKNIAAIVYQVNQKGKSLTTTDSDPNDEKKVDGPKKKRKPNQKPTVKDLPFDRQIVATKLAAALVMQGRDDISTEDMDKLIYVFILLVKISKDQVDHGGDALQMKNVLPELGIVVEQPADVIPSIVEEMIENEVSALVAEVEEEISTEGDKDANAQSSASALESLTDSDLQTLLQNFKHLSTEEQHHLIAHLKKLETADPARVEKLRKYVNASGTGNEPSSSSSTFASGSNNTANRSKFVDSMVKPAQHHDPSPPISKNRSFSDDDKTPHDRNNRDRNNSHYQNFMDDEDEEDDDDYNVDDVMKAASSNVKRISEETSRQGSNSRDDMNENKKHQSYSQTKNDAKMKDQPSKVVPSKLSDRASSTSSTSALTFNRAGLNISLSDTQNLIANLMGSLQQSSSLFNEQKTQQTGNKKEPDTSNNTIATVINHQRLPSNTQAAAPHQSNISNSVPFYQQQQQQQQQQQLQQQQQQQVSQNQQQLFPGYQQQTGMNNMQAAGYYNNANYNNPSNNNPYSNFNWSNGQMSNMQAMPFNMQNFTNPQMQQQMGGGQQAYNNMFARGDGGNNNN